MIHKILLRKADKILRSGMLIFALLLSTILGWAAPDAAQIQRFISAHQFNADAPNSPAAQSVFRQAQAYINREGEAAVRAIPGGDKLLGWQSRHMRFQHIQRGLSGCGPSRRMLSQNLLDIARSQDECDFIPPVGGRSLSQTAQFWNRAATNSDAFKDFAASAVYDEAILTTARTLWDYQRQMGEAVTEAEKVESICRQVGNCSKSGLRRKLQDEWNRYKALPKEPVPPVAGQVVRLNAQIRQLNQLMGGIRVGVDRGWIDNFLISTSDPSLDTNGQLQQSLYHERYFQVASQGLGTFLMTDHLSERVGKLQGLNDAERVSGRNGSTFRFTPHRQITERDLRTAWAEVKNTTNEQLRELHSLQISRPIFGDGLSKVKDMMLTHPAAVGIALMKNPQLVTAVCQLIGEIERSDVRGERLKKAAIVGGVVIGTAAALTGVGALITAGIYGAATATGAAAMTVATVSFGVGTAVGLGETAFYSREALASRARYRELQSAIITGTNNAQGVREAQAAIAANQEAVTNAMIAGIFSAVDLGAFTAVARGARGLQRVTAIQRMTTALKETTALAAQNPKVARLLAWASRVGGQQGWVGKLMQQLSGMTEAVRRRFLEQLARMGDLEAQEVLRRLGQCAG